MPLNKLENFIKNTEGRILYVNPNDLDATDGIENQGNSLTKPFKTIQRALIESARFSYLEGNDNDIVEKTTILLFPGEHLIDNRPGFGIKSVAGDARAVTPTGAVSNIGATETFTLTLNSNFDLTQEDNILYKFNSVHGGVVVPRGTSIVGLDLRKTKIRPKYVPNPTDDAVPDSAIFRITGSCYFWQFTIFDGDENTLVYTDNTDFGSANQSKPTFSHHKITVFEYADGVNVIDDYQLTDLQVYYSKLSNAFNRASTREITQKYPVNPEGFAPQRPEFEIVGAFATDDKAISRIIAGDGATAGNLVTVTTSLPHELSSGTPIKVNGVNVSDFNISTKVQNVIDENRFTYLLPYVRPNLPAGPSAGLSGSGAYIAVETDTVTGASPYVFNCSMRSVWGMCGMHADGSKATGFKSMVVAQFTGVSLQKDDRAFAEYNPTNRSYDKITYTKQTGEKLSSESSSQINETVYHLKPSAVYRSGWKTAHITLSNDAVVQIVSVFAIGYHIHFLMKSGGDASVTNSNSNFGQFALAAQGFKKRAFDKDNKGYVTNVITPRAVVGGEFEVEWLQVDKDRTRKIYAACLSGDNSDGASINLNDPAVTRKNRLYLLGQTNPTLPPGDIAQGFRVGAKVGEKIFVNNGAYEATIYMSKDDKEISSATSEKKYESVFHSNSSNNVNPSIFTIEDVGGHELMNGESIRIISESGRLPEGLDPHSVYYAVTSSQDGDLASNEIRIASSRANSELADPEYITTISDRASGALTILSRVSDKRPGELGHPIQFDEVTYKADWDLDAATAETFEPGGWFVHVNMDNTINEGLANKDAAGNAVNYYPNSTVAELSGEEIPYITRRSDDRSLDDKLFKVRYVVPKEIQDAKAPTDGFILQDSSATGVTRIEDFSRTEIGNGNDITIQPNDPGYEFNRNLRYLSQLSYNSSSRIATVRSDKVHNLKANNQIIVRGVTTDTNTDGLFDREFNGTFKVESVIDDKTFTYKVVKLVEGEPIGDTISVGNYTNNTHTRDTNLPRFERNDTKENLYIYRTETITDYKYNVQDGVYHLYVLNGNNAVEQEFTEAKYNQNVVNLYPELDRDNTDDNAPAAQSYAQLAPIGQVVTNDLKKSITRESINKFLDTFGATNTIVSVTGSPTATLTLKDEHHLNGLKYIETGDISSVTNNAAPHVGGTYYNIKLFSSSVAPATAPWQGATAKVVVDDTTKLVTSAEITESGSGYADGDELYFDSSSVAAGGIGGAPTNSKITLKKAHLSFVDDTNYVQVTGITTGTDAYYRIKGTPAENQINVATHASNDVILPGQQVIDLGRYSEITGFDPTTDSVTSDEITITTFDTTSSHGLMAGNAIRLLNASDKKLVDLIVQEVKTVTQFTAVTTGITLTASGDTAPKYLLKHGLGSHDAISGRAGENLGVRGLPIYGHDSLILGGANQLTTDAKFIVNIPDGTVTGTTINSGTSAEKAAKRLSVESRFPLGSYIQIDSEILRVRKSSLGETNNDNLYVVRGALGTNIAPHDVGSVIRKIEPLALEVRRPSILRASGHTFEYLGYGPGNYSTALPQITKRTLTEREEFLSQSQETSCGTVVYTGMNDKGDFYIGNTKISADSGKQVTFDIPIPTVTGEDPSKLSVVFDEVIIKERLLVEGGASKQVLSQFNGPVTFNGTVRFNKDLKVSKGLKVEGLVQFTYNKANTSTDCAAGSLDAALNVRGGVAIGEDLHVCKEVKIFSPDDNDLAGATTGALTVAGGVGIGKNLYVNTFGKFGGNVMFMNGAHFPSNKFITLGGGNSANTDKAFIYHDATSGMDNLRVSARGDDTFLFLQSKKEIILGAEDNSSQGLSYIVGGRTKIFHAGTGVLETREDLGSTNDKVGIKITGELEVTGDIAAYATSDQLLKDNISPIPDALNKVISISGNTFDWTNGGASDTGVIAQEIESLGLPGLVTTRDDGYKAVRYEKLVPVLIQAIKELATKVDKLENPPVSPEPEDPNIFNR